MITRRPANTRKHMNPGWIETYRTFSNNSYWDPNYINFSILEVINDDRVQPRNCVPIHQHMDMEILGYIVEGSCYHNDSLRNILDVPAGSVQRMTTGTGIWHTEGNMQDVPNHYLQIWLRPNKMGIQPNYTVKHFDRNTKLNNFCHIASQHGPIVIQSDAIVKAGIFTQEHLEYIDSKKRYYLYIVTGTATINGVVSDTGDGYSFENESLIEIDDPSDSEIILFILP